MQTNVAIGVGSTRPLTLLSLGTVGSLATWKDTAINGNLVIGMPTLTISNRMPGANTGTYKAVIRLIVPRLATLGTSTSDGYVADQKVSYSNLVNIEMLFSNKATLADRKDLAVYVKDLFADATFLDGLIERFTLDFDATLEAHVE